MSAVISQTEPVVGNIRRIDTTKIFQLLQHGTIATCRDTLNAIFDEVDFRNLDSLLVRVYVAMDVYISVSTFSKRIGISDDEFTDMFGTVDDIEQNLSSAEKTIDFFVEMTQRCIERRGAVVRTSTNDVIQRAKELIEQRYTQEDLSLKAVAAEMNFTPTYFSALFKKETGINFIDYLTQVRIYKAKALLCSTKKMVYEVAYEVGFKDYRYFGQIFKKCTGFTPREYQCGKNSLPEYPH